MDPALFPKLDRMRLRIGRAHGTRSGETPVRGLTQESGVEIESFKTYAPGDDIRYMDWNAVGRLDQLLTRRFVAEREIPVHVLLDASASMGVPPEDGKLPFARRLVAALAYVALNGNDPVRIGVLRDAGDGSVLRESPQLRHRGRYGLLRPFLSGITPGGKTVLAEGVSAYVGRRHERGVAFLLSDFLVPPGVYESALARLQERRLKVHAIHVVGRMERDLGRLGGRLRLRDAETGAVRQVVLGDSERRRYAEAFAARLDAIRGFCHRRDVGHATVCAGDGVEHALTGVLAASGVLQLR